MEKGRCMSQGTIETYFEEPDLLIEDDLEVVRSKLAENDRAYALRMRQKWNRLLAQVKDSDLESVAKSRPRARRKVKAR